MVVAARRGRERGLGGGEALNDWGSSFGLKDHQCSSQSSREVVTRSECDASRRRLASGLSTTTAVVGLGHSSHRVVIESPSFIQRRDHLSDCDDNARAAAVVVTED